MVTSHGSAMKNYFLVKYLHKKRLITHQQSNVEFKTPTVQCQNDDSEILFYIFFLLEQKKNKSAFIAPKDLPRKLRQFECFCNLKNNEWIIRETHCFCNYVTQHARKYTTYHPLFNANVHKLSYFINNLTW